jgi:16S rRNA G966 N2-methylase RsmD
MATTSVLYAHRCDAKALKSRLEQESLLDKRFRMTPSASDATVVLPSNNHHHDGESDFTAEEEGSGIIDAIVSGRCIAVPVIDECIDRLNAVRKHTNTSDKDSSWETYVVAYGRQSCPFSTSTLGNQNHVISSRLVKQQQKSDTIIEKSKSKNNNEVLSSNLNNIQYVLVKTMVDYRIENILKKKSDNNNTNQDELESFQKMVETSVLSLSVKTCPKKLEVMGDDRTLVIPSTAFLINEDDMTRTQKFHQFISKMIDDKTSNTTNNNTVYQIQENFWKNLASLYQSPRVVRRGDIDPENGKRESGHRLLWPLPGSVTPSSTTTTAAAAITCRNHGYIPQTTGPDSPGWITVTEHKISQSFDLTRVMFSRGNVTEKKRFGSLVQPDEYVLDMYAGIGYYTLPALVHGHARHVTSCEWNPNAIFALRYNLKSNRVGDRATVLEGDCRVTLRDLIAKNNQYDDPNEYHYFDRISLGLLPSSEGGWPIAVECLNREKGGWLHVHGNVPTVERQQWAHWLCRSLVHISQKNEHSTDWHAICSHIERVKSFAPKVDHFVADVFLGPLNSPHLSCRNGLASTTGVIDSGVFAATPRDVSPPSCALGSGGVLHQEWMVGSK